MNVIVVGCGRLGSDLAYRSFQKGHQVVVIDNSSEAFGNLPADFRGRMVEGEGLAQDVLHRAGVEEADSLAAATDSDAVNAVIAHIAHSVYNISNVVLLTNNPAWRQFHEAFGVQIVSSASWGAKRIEELLSPAAMPVVFSAGNGEVEVYEFVVTAQWNGSSLADLLQESECIPVAVTRAGRSTLPSRESYLETGDVLHFSATFEGIEALRARVQRLEGKN